MPVWNAAEDRFPTARSRLNLYHAEEHLWEVANELYGKGTPDARQWVEPVLKQLRKDDHLGVIQSLKELPHGLKEALQKKVNTQVDYLENNKNRMGYHQIIKARKAVDRGNTTVGQKAWDRLRAPGLGRGGVHLQVIPTPFQPHRPVLISGGRRSPNVFGNPLAPRPLVPPLPSII